MTLLNGEAASESFRRTALPVNSPEFNGASSAPEVFGLVRDWRGWAGEKSCESLEGHLRISATSDSLGHVSLRVELGDNQVPIDWRAETSLFLEAGQLESMAKGARSFFSGD